MQVYSFETIEKHDFEGAPQWYEHESDRVIETEGYKILWHFTIQCDNIVIIRYCYYITDKTKEVKIVDVTIPGDVRVNEREVGRTGK